MNPKATLERLGIEPKKSLGQNFLHDPNALRKIAALAEIGPQDTVLEIGPGLGGLTEVLASQAQRVVAVELDDRLIPALAWLDALPNVEIVHQDILTVDLDALIGPEPYLVCANVPYYITSAILRFLLERAHRPRRLVLTVQLEVAERLVAQPGEHSLLSISAQYYARPRIVMRLNRAAFYPRPDVDSAVVRLDCYDRPAVDAPSDALFFRVVRAGFSQKRKQLKNALAEGLHLAAEAAAALSQSAGVDPRRRAETLTLEEWAAIAQAYAAQIAST